MRVNITLEHKESGERLYLTQKNKRNNPDRLELKKYSPKLRKHVTFRGVKELDTLVKRMCPHPAYIRNEEVSKPLIKG